MRSWAMWYVAKVQAMIRGSLMMSGTMSPSVELFGNECAEGVCSVGDYATQHVRDVVLRQCFGDG